MWNDCDMILFRVKVKKHLTTISVWHTHNANEKKLKITRKQLWWWGLRQTFKLPRYMYTCDCIKCKIILNSMDLSSRWDERKDQRGYTNLQFPVPIYLNIRNQLNVKCIRSCHHRLYRCTASQYTVAVDVDTHTKIKPSLKRLLPKLMVKVSCSSWQSFHSPPHFTSSNWKSRLSFKPG